MNRPVALVTGGTSGVGLAIARHLAAHGDRVVIASRNAEKGSSTAGSLSRETGEDNVESIQIDLGNLESVRQAASLFKQRYSRLDVLSNNAGIISLSRTLSTDGYEKVFAVNYLGHFLLTMLLTDLLASSPASRVISVAGNVSVLRRIKLDFDDLMQQRRYNPVRAAMGAALAKSFFMERFSLEEGCDGIVAHAFHPGLVRSGMGDDLPFPLALPLRLARLVMGTGCPTGEYLATSPEVLSQSGCFYENRRRVKLSNIHHGVEDKKRLMIMSKELVGL